MRISKYNNQFHNAHTRAIQRRNIVISMLFVFTGCLGFKLYGDHTRDLLSPLPAYAVETVHETTLVDRCRHPKTVPDMVDCTFGADAEKAFQLLSCENKALNPKAINVNTDGVHSKDYGIFQINDHWQGVTNVAFLTDPEVNVAMAWNIYVRDGHSFKKWSCGRKLGI